VNHVIKIKKECISINDSAMLMLSQSQYGETNKLILDTVLQLFNKAISCDTNFFSAYYNKLMVLGSLKRYNDEIIVINKILALRKNDLVMYVKKGFIFEQIGQLDSAKIIYSIAEKEYTNKIKEYPNNIELKTEKIMLTAIKDSKEEARIELERYIKEYPGNTMLLTCKEMLNNFDKEKVLNGELPTR